MINQTWFSTWYSSILGIFLAIATYFLLVMVLLPPLKYLWNKWAKLWGWDK